MLKRYWYHIHQQLLWWGSGEIIEVDHPHTVTTLILNIGKQQCFGCFPYIGTVLKWLCIPTCPPYHPPLTIEMGKSSARQ